MSDNRVVRFALSDFVDATKTVDSAVNVTDARVQAKTEAGPLALAAKGGAATYGMCHDWSGNLYIADTARSCIIKVSEGGQVAYVAGKPGTSGNNRALMNVAPSAARFNLPSGIACDKSGTLYVADAGNNQIRTIKDGLVSVLAGDGACGSGFVDDACLDARFNDPEDVYVDRAGVVYVADTDNHAIRKISGGQVTTIAGNGVAGDKENIKASKYINTFTTPYNLCTDTQGNIYVIDFGNNKIKKITANGWVYLFSGSGASGRSLGYANAKTTYAYTCSYNELYDIDNDESGNIYILDKNNVTGDRLLKLDFNGRPGVIAELNSSRTYQGESYCICCSPSSRIFVGMYA
jgi:sugar lactone lactonase YvrE